MIDWKKHPEASFALIKFFNSKNEQIGCDAIEKPKQKTVADAVEHFDGVWPAPILGDPPPKDEQVIIYCTDSTPSGSKVGNFYAGGRGFDSSYFYQVCTRAEFEAYVKEQDKPHFKATRENLEKIAKDAQGVFEEVEQEDEKWTHTYGEHRCRIKVDEPDFEGYIVLVTEHNGYIPCKPENLKHIKPTISEDAKRQLELYVQYRVDRYGDYDMKSDLSDYLSHHEII